MLTRFVRIQLIIFTIASVIGIAAMVARLHAGADTAGHRPHHRQAGIARRRRALPVQQRHLPRRRGRQGHRRKTVDGNHVEATLSLDTSPRIPANLVAKVRSVSAVGEQYVDLQPPNDSPPYLHDGSVIALADTAIPEPVGPDAGPAQHAGRNHPEGQARPLLDESFKAFNGAGYDIGSLLDSRSKLTKDLNGVADQSRALDR